MADDLGYGDPGCYGQQRLSTPHIDRLAAEGMKFTDHYAGHTVCRPSRLVLRTGLHSGHTAVSSNTSYHLPPDAVITAKLLKRAGYTVGGVGKWALGEADTPGAPHKQGFDLWYGYLNQVAAHNYWPQFLWENGTKVKLRNEVDYADHGYAKGISGVATKRVDYSHDLMADRALRFIREHQRGPFFLQCHFTLPHANNEGEPHGMEVPDLGRYAEKDWPAAEKGFAAMVSRLDRDVGRIVELLRKLGIAERTLVLFTSDNGPHGEGGHDVRFFDSNGPLRGFKRALYEGGIRVPMIAWWPGTVEAGAVTDHPSAFWDFMPTACDLAGVDPPGGIDGISYLPTLRGEPAQQQTHDHLYWQYLGDGRHHKQAARFDGWKVVRPGKGEPIELYHLANDPGEQHDLANEHPERVERARKLFARYAD